MLEILKRLLEHEDLSHCPDLKEVIAYLGLDEDDDPETIREAVEEAIAAEGGDDDGVE